MRIHFLISTFLILVSPAVFSLEAECEQILKASEALIKQGAWHSITEIDGGMRIEAIKSNGKFYQQVGGEWTAFPVNIDDAQRTVLAQIRSGEIKLTQCKVVGSGIVEGVPVTVVSSRTEVYGAPAAGAQLHTGKIDGLPYRQTTDNITVVYRYKGIAAPKL